MTKKSDAPAIRFKGFSDAWEQRKLSEMCGTFEYGLNAAAKEFDGKNKYIRITDIDDASREFLLSDLSSPDICLDGMSKYLLSSGDIVFARTGASVGKTYIYRENDGIVYFAGFLIRAKVNQDNDAEFVFQSTLSPSYEKYIRITSQRSGQPGVNAQEYGEYDLFAPSKEEQQRIGQFLRGIDNLITLHQRKFEKLTNVKKSMLEKMFPQNGSSYPKIRFKGFTDPWEQRKFSDVVATRRGLTYKPSDIRKNGVRVLRSSNIAEDSFVLSDEDVFVVREAVNIDCVRANDILITAANGSSRLVGKHTIISGIPEESAVHGGFMLLGTTKEPHFVNASMGSSWYRRFIELFVAGGNGAIGNLNKNDLDNQDIAIPSEKEQKKIGSFFRQLDNLITLHQRQPFLHSTPEISLTVQLIHPFYTSSWEQRKLGDVVKEITRNDPESEAPIMMITANNGFIEQSERSDRCFRGRCSPFCRHKLCRKRLR